MKPTMRHLFVVAFIISCLLCSPRPAQPADNDRSLRDWIDQLHDSDVEKRVDAAMAIARHAPHAASAATDLCEMLGEKKGRWAIERALRKIGSGAIPALAKKFDADGSLDTLRLIADFGPDAASVLKQALLHKDSRIRLLAAMSLAKHDSTGKIAIPALVELMNTKEGFMYEVNEKPGGLGVPIVKWLPPAGSLRAAAARELIQFGPSAIPSLLDELEPRPMKFNSRALTFVAAESPNLWRAFKEAAPRLNPAAMALGLWLQLPAFLDELEEHDHLSAQLAAWALAEVPASAEKATPSLMRTAQSWHPLVRAEAVRSLRRIHADPRVITPLLLDRARDIHPAVRWEAVRALGELPSADERVVKVLLERLHDTKTYPYFEASIDGTTDYLLEHASSVFSDDFAISYSHLLTIEEMERYDIPLAALRALLQLGPEAQQKAMDELLPMLVAELKKPQAENEFPSRPALMLWSQIGRKGKALLPKLEKLMDDPAIANPREVVWAMSAVGPEGLASAQRLFQRSLPGRRLEILEGISFGAGTRYTVPIYAAALKDDDACVRHAAVETIFWYARDIPPGGQDFAFGALQRMLDDDDEEVALRAADTLLEVGIAKEEAMAAYRRVSRGNRLAARAAAALLQQGDTDTDAVAVLRKALTSRRPSLAEEAVGRLKHVGPGAKPLVPELLDLVKNDAEENSAARSAAIHALGSIGPGAKAAVAVLVKLCGDRATSLTVRLKAVEALGNIGAADVTVLRALVNALGPAGATEKPNEDLRRETIVALGKLGTSAKPAVPMLLDILKSGRHEYDVLSALQAIGPDAKEAVPALLRLLKERPGNQSVLETLAAMGPAAKDAVVFLQDMCDKDSRSPELQVALARITGDEKKYVVPPPKPDLAGLRKRLASPGRVDEYSLNEISSLGNQAAEALPEMLDILTRRDPGRCFHTTVFDYLEKLGPAAAPAIPHLKKYIAEADDPFNLDYAESTLEKLQKAADR